MRLFFVHLSSECDAILVVNLHFIFFKVFYPTWNVGCSHLVFRVSCASLDVFDPSSFPFRPYPCRRRSHSGRIRCYLGRIPYSCCFPHRILLALCVGFSRHLSILFLHFFFCIFVSFEGCAGASCVASIESFSRAPALTSKWQNRTSSWVRRPS